MPAVDDATYHAVSDRTRRQILDLLRVRGPLRAGDIAERFPRISRPAVSKHMRVLRRARLVEGARAGRERWYHVNPRPLREMYEGWLRRYETLWTERLRTLKQLIEDAERGRKGETKTERGKS